MVLRPGNELHQSVLCIFFMAHSVYNIAPRITAWNQALTRLVWDLKASIDPYQTDLMLDYNTYQAFYDFEKTVVYNPMLCFSFANQNSVSTPGAGTNQK